MNQYAFFRNDDVRNVLDDSLVKITNLFIMHKVPISHAVEPGNVSTEVVNWLLQIKSKYPDLIEITQHGYKHILNYQAFINGKLRKGEFGGTRTFEEQLRDISAGKDLMNKHFNDNWFESFCFPFGARNDDSIKALNAANLKVINGGYNNALKYKSIYSLGRLFKKRLLFGKRISYNLRKVPGTNLFEIDVNFGFIKKYINQETEAHLFNIDELKAKLKKYENEKVIGILIHHRYHSTPEKIALIEELLDFMINQNKYVFKTQKAIFEIFK